MRYSSYELKYCERCGGLGLRRRTSELPYCCDCEQMMRAFLPPATTGTAACGGLRRIVQRMKPPVLAPDGQAGAQEAAHVS
jgi:hypothetical protein